MSISPFRHTLDCSNQDDLINRYGSRSNDTRALCILENRGIISSRAYFVLMMVNAACVVITTAMFACFAMTGAERPYYYINSISLSPDRKKLIMYRNKNALQQRSIFGTTLGAFGHLIISNCILTSQAFHTSAACESYIWCISIGFYTWFFAFIWRSYRLHFLIRLNELKARYTSFAINRADTTSSTGQQSNLSHDKDRRWFLQNKDCKRIQPSRPFKIYMISLISLCLVCGILEGFIFHFPSSRITCKDFWGLYQMSAFTLLFIVICAPITFWRLYRFKDSYGIRNEILVDIVVGAICFIMAFVWNALYTKTPFENVFYYKAYFAPRNWLFIFTACAHIMSVIVPLLQLSHRWYMAHREHHIHAQVEPDSADAGVTGDTIHQTPSALERLLTKPEAVDAMLKLAVKDFSSENIQFYEQYLKLVDAVRQYEKSEQRSHRSSVTLPPPTFLAHMSRSDHSSTCSSSTADHRILTSSPAWHELIQIPLKGELEHAFFDLYSTFIAEQSPLQVNVSYQARKELDRIAGNARCNESEGWKVPWNRVASPSPASMSPPCSTHLEWSSRSRFPIVPSPDERISELSRSNSPLRLALLEQARKEVFWNIFVSVFPKYINDLKKARG